MSEPTGLPPDLPPEYAEAYRRGYRRAYTGEPESVDLDELFSEVEPEPWLGPTHREAATGSAARPGWLTPALVACVVLALVLGAYGAGRLLSGAGSSAPAAPESAADRERGRRVPPAEHRVWEGAVSPLSGITATSSCVLSPSRDSAGRTVTYEPVNVVDEDFTTAWRCPGAGEGVLLRLSLGREVRVAEVGLVPGYAKTDPRSGADRYAENNRLTRVRWTFAGGRSVVQPLDGSPGNRDLQTLRIPPVTTDQVTLEVLASTPGPRDTIAVSEIVLAEAVAP